MNYTIYILHCSSSLSKDYAELVTTLWYWLLVELQNVPIIQKIEVSENKRYVFCIAVAVALFIPYQKMLQLHDFQLKHLVIILMIHMLVLIDFSLRSLLLKNLPFLISPLFQTFWNWCTSISVVFPEHSSTRC